MSKPPKKQEKDPKQKAEELKEQKEHVTNLMKEVFEIQLADIEKKIQRIDDREKAVKAGKLETEEKIDGFQKEHDGAIVEKEQLVAEVEEEKIQRRDEMIFLTEEIVIRTNEHKKHVEELKVKFEKQLVALKERRENLEEEIQGLEEFRARREEYNEEAESMEKTLQETEVQHQRNLYEIQKKWDIARLRVKKELESRLLLLSIELQEKSKSRIGLPCHRMTQENRVISSELFMMKEELEGYENKQEKSKTNIALFKSHQSFKKLEKDKAVARTIIQSQIIKQLKREKEKLSKKLEEFRGIEATNRELMAKVRVLKAQNEKKMSRMEEVNVDIKEKTMETQNMIRSTKKLQKSCKRLQGIIHTALTIAEDAMSITLIPLGGKEEEKFLSTEAKIRLYRKRREGVFRKRGRILQHLLDTLAKAQITEEEKSLLKSIAEPVNFDEFDFRNIYAKPGVYESELMLEFSDKSIVSVVSDRSLPRSLSDNEKAEIESFKDLEDVRAESRRKLKESKSEVKKEAVEEKVEEKSVGRASDKTKYSRDDNEEDEMSEPEEQKSTGALSQPA